MTTLHSAVWHFIQLCIKWILASSNGNYSLFGFTDNKKDQKINHVEESKTPDVSVLLLSHIVISNQLTRYVCISLVLEETERHNALWW